MACVELPKDAYGRSIPLDTGTLYKKNGVVKFIYHYDYDPRDKAWYVETDDGSRSVSELLLDRDDSCEKLLADLKRGASRVHHPECAYFARDENDCDQCEAVRSFACKKIAFGDIESRIRKLLGEDKYAARAAAPLNIWHIPRTTPRLAAYGSSFTAPRAGRTETATRWMPTARATCGTGGLYDARWFIETYEREAWCEEVTRLGRQL